ncbi:MAG TPA: hypothetical protein VHB98_09705, partial [Chloroflexota bacterium]|nr:hypothetical protein [Chloroflexota bacterium]
RSVDELSACPVLSLTLIDNIVTHAAPDDARGYADRPLLHRVYMRVLRPALAQLLTPTPPADPALRPAFDHLQAVLDRYLAQTALAA